MGEDAAAPALRFFNEAVDAIIAARKALFDRGGEAPRDLLTLLIAAKDPETGAGLPDASIRANIVTFIMAGHETTANGLTWTLYLLSQSPEWRERAESGSGRGCSIRKRRLPSRNAKSCAPCSRRRCVFTRRWRMLARQAIADDEILGRRVPAGTVVAISPYVLHRRRGLWDDPDAFDPSRFLGERRERIDRFAYIPFGAGPRVCIGMPFAMQEGIIILANLLRAFRFELVAGHRVMPQQRVTLGRAGA